MKYLALMLALAFPAQAALTEAMLRQVELAPAPGAVLPGHLAFADGGMPTTLAAAQGGLPAIVIFADYTCRTICGPTLTLTAAALEEAGLLPGRDLRLLVLPLDPADGPAEAAAMRDAALGGRTEGAQVLTGDATTTAAALAAIGYRAVYDAERDQFAHPSGVLVLAADGRVVRLLSALGQDPLGFRLALAEARGGLSTTPLADRLLLLCYGYDAAHGLYSRAIHRLLAIACTGFALLLAGLLWWPRRRAP